jgi:ribosomal protein S18 acetylase RimI-like enzyme
MKFKIFLEDAPTKPRIEVESHGDWNHRVFFEGYLKEEHKNFLERGRKALRGEATVDLAGDGAYINRIDAYPKGQKFGSELLDEILKELAKRGFKTARTYIENSNPDSKMLFKKFKFKEEGYDRSHIGTYWVRNL